MKKRKRNGWELIFKSFKTEAAYLRQPSSLLISPKAGSVPVKALALCSRIFFNNYLFIHKKKLICVNITHLLCVKFTHLYLLTKTDCCFMRKSTLQIPKFLSVALLFMLSAFSALAQNVISGNVTDSKSGDAVSNVTVTVKGTRVSVQTGADGSFKITAPASAKTLVFSSIGYAGQEAAINGSNAIRINLVQTDQKLDEIVVVAYGTRKKTDLTGSISQVSAKDFQKGNIASPEQLLQGKVAGLEVTTGGGSAGGGSKIRIRGGASLNASNDPLIVIDGVPIGNTGVAGSGNLLNTINPNDIESISVLKDASATALYGTNASNGILLITTKKGNKGKTRFNYNTQISVAKVFDDIDVLSAAEVRSVVAADAASTGNNTYLNLLGKASTNWQDKIYQTARGVNNNISASGGLNIKKFTLPYRISLGYLYQEGVLKTNKFDRLSTAINLSPKFLNDHLAVNVNFKYSQTQNQFANEGAVGSAVSFDPTQYVRNNNPKTGGFYEWMQADGNPIDLATRNPLALLEQRDNTSRVNRIIGNVQLDYKLHFLPDLHLKANLGMDNADGRGNDIIYLSSPTNYKTNGRVTHYEQGTRNYLAEVSLYYEKNLGRNSKVDVLAGHSYVDIYTNVKNFASYGQDGKVIPETVPTFAKDKPETRLESYFAGMNITLFDKYLLTGSFRRDASSRFAKENRVGFFPAGAFAWKLKEQFFRNSNLVSDLKLRVGYGTTGNQTGIGYYTYLPVYSQSNSSAQYQFGSNYYSFLRPGAYDKDIKWETTTTTNLGLDFGFLHNRISGSIDVYKKKTKDLLSVVPIAPGSNFDIQLLTNVGNVENEGMEITINTTPVKSKNLTWDFGFNVTYNDTKITNLLRNQDPSFKGIDVSGISGGTGNNIGKFAVGYAPFVFNVYKQVYDPATGKPIEGLYEDINRDGKIDDADRYYYKKPAADFLYGLNTQVAYKKWTLGIAAHGMIGNYLYNNFNSENGVLRHLKDPINFVANVSTNYLETGFKNNQYLSDYYVENASFFRLDNINLGYNFGDWLFKKTSFRVSASVQNVFVITKYSGADPESANSTGVDNNIYPRPKIFSVGANLDF